MSDNSDLQVFRLQLSVMVPVTGFIDVEAENVESAIEKLQDDAHKHGWSCNAWNRADWPTVTGADWRGAQDLIVEPYTLPDGSETDHCKLID